MAFDFPATPSSGAIFSPVAGGPSYKWDGEKWQFYSAVAYATKTASPGRKYLINPTGRIAIELGSAGLNFAGVKSAYFCEQWKIENTIAAVQMFVAGNPASYINLDSFVAIASLAAGDYVFFHQPIEGLMMDDFKYGAAGLGRPSLLAITLISSVSGTYSIALRNMPSNRSFTHCFTLVANTETRVEISVPPDTANLSLGSAATMDINLSLCCGSTYKSAADDVWTTGNFIAGPTISNNLATANVNIKVKEFSFYLDPDNTKTAPKFQVPAYNDDLLDCKRYFQKALFPLKGMTVSGGSIGRASADLEVEMRVSPTCNLVGSVLFYNTAYGTAPITSLGTGYASGKHIEFDVTVGTWSGSPAGTGAVAMVYQGQTGSIACNARM